MPIPKPRENETEKDFIKRCMKDEIMKQEFKDIKQRLAVCYSQWRKKEMAEPTVSDVHIPRPDEKVSVKVKPKFYIEAVPVFKAGEWKGQKYTIEDLDEIVRNTNALIKANLHEPPIKLGHDESQEYLLEKTGLPSFGYVKRLYRVGDEIFADVEVPQEVAEWVERRFYDKVSAEIYLNYVHPETKENIGKVLRAIAFLGADLPAVKGLGSIAFYNETKKIKKQAIVFEDKNLQEVKSMTKWSLDEIKRILPCCYEKIKKYMEEKKKTILDGDELAELLVLIRYEETKEQQNKDETSKENIEVPEGYKWDEQLGRCVRLDGKEDRIVCPKGYKWDEEKQRCIPVSGDDVEIKEEVKQETQEENQENSNKEIDEDKLFELLEKIVEMVKSEITEEFQLPGGEPRGWTKESFRSAFEKLGGTFESCVDRISDKIDDPESFCAWLKYKATGKWPGTEAWRKRPHLSEENKTTELSEEDKKIKELQDKINELDNKIFLEKVNELKEKYRNVWLPRFDEYISKFTEIVQQNKIVKFGENEIDARKLFLDFLKDIAETKIVQFGEIVKTPKEYEELISEEDKQKFISKFSEITNGHLENIDLALLAEKISEKENIPYRDALIKAKKILQQGGK